MGWIACKGLNMGMIITNLGILAGTTPRIVTMFGWRRRDSSLPKVVRMVNEWFGESGGLLRVIKGQ
jgi:hypothetical protein